MRLRGAILLSALPGLALAPPQVTEIALAEDPAAVRAELHALLDQARAARGLAALVLDAALSRAAQAHVDDMVARDYFALENTDGQEVEGWVAAEGYDAVLLAEKVQRSPLPPAELAAAWARDGAHEGSLFHPALTDLGVGVGLHRGRRIYAFVLALPRASAVAAVGRALDDVGALRRDYLAAVNLERAGDALPALAADAVLDAAAQAHAAALLAATLAGKPPESLMPLGERVREARLGQNPTLARGGGQTSRRFGVTPQSGYAVGSSIVHDALAVESAVASALEQSAPALREAAYGRLGLGVAHAQVGEQVRTVWVACLTRL